MLSNLAYDSRTRVRIRLMTRVASFFCQIFSKKKNRKKNSKNKKKIEKKIKDRPDRTVLARSGPDFFQFWTGPDRPFEDQTERTVGPSWTEDRPVPDRTGPVRTVWPSLLLHHHIIFCLAR